MLAFFVFDASFGYLEHAFEIFRKWLANAFLFLASRPRVHLHEGLNACFSLGSVRNQFSEQEFNQLSPVFVEFKM